MEETVKIKLGVTISLSRDSSEEGDIHGEAVVNYLTVTRTPIRKKKKKKTKHRRKASSSREEKCGMRQRTLLEFFKARRSTTRRRKECKRTDKGKKMMKLCAKNEQDLKVVDVEGKGKGVVPTRPFHHSELICEYPGELVSAKEARSREEEYTKDSSIGCYMYYFTHNGSKWCIDATRDNGRKGRLINHSKKRSNIVAKVVEVDDRPYICLMASRDVMVGEELLYDYGERRRGVVQSMPWLAIITHDSFEHVCNMCRRVRSRCRCALIGIWS